MITQNFAPFRTDSAQKGQIDTLEQANKCVKQIQPSFKQSVTAYK